MIFKWGKQNENKKLVHAAYKIFLNREPDPDGEKFWEKRLKCGLAHDQFLWEIVNSEEFAVKQPDWNYPGKWAKLIKLGADITIPLGFGGHLTGPIRDTSVFSILLDLEGNYEPHLTRFLSEILHQGDTFIDVGANLGYFTILGSRLVGQEGNVVSFEPMPINFEYCKKNIALNNLDNVTLYNNGLWDREEKKEIAIPSSFYAGAHFGSLDPHEMKAIVECITLDKMNLDPEVIKMDIEGAEPMALKGMLKTLENSKPILVMELNRHCLNTFYGLDTIDVWTPLHELGYEISILYAETKKKVNSIKELNALCPIDNLVDLVAIHR